MVAQGARIAEEYYFSILLDRANRNYLCDVQRRGRHGDRGARRRASRGAGAKVEVDPNVGIDEKAKEIVAGGQVRPRDGRQVAPVLVKLWEVYHGEDATLVEVNPLAHRSPGEVIALDGKVTLDENADFRHPDHADLVDEAAEDPLEAKAKANDLNYVKLDGEVGIIGNGAGS
jgi:succinyl-CoA synthetase beta subunit